MRSEIGSTLAQSCSDLVVNGIEDANLLRIGQMTLRIRSRSASAMGGEEMAHKEGVDGSLLSSIDKLTLIHSADALHAIREQSSEALLAAPSVACVERARAGVLLAQSIAVLSPQYSMRVPQCRVRVLPRGIGVEDKVLEG